MSNLKLFGSTRHAQHTEKVTYTNTAAEQRAKKKPRWPAVVILLLLILEGAYFTVVYSNISIITKWRDVYIQTAMTTMSHQWLATAIFPQSVIDLSLASMEETMTAQIGVNSNWGSAEADVIAVESETETIDLNPDETVNDVVADIEDAAEQSTTDDKETASAVSLDEARLAFFDRFWEIDEDSFDTYLESHPELLADGWEGIYINEAGLDDSGTDIYTIYGDQILAIDVPNLILLIRVTGTTYRGVLAVAKDSSQLRIGVSSMLGEYGQYAGDIAEQENAVLAINASAFYDPDGVGTGGTLGGYTMSQGSAAGDHMGWGYKRLELRSDNLMYIVDSQSDVNADTTDAVEFSPALIVDGEILVDENCGWTGMHPRSCIGQTSNYDVLMLVIEGRMTSSLGVSVVDCAEIMYQYGCVQAINQDGGSSAIMWYRGEYITKCSNGYTPGRQLPNAWVYGYSDE